MPVAASIFSGRKAGSFQNRPFGPAPYGDRPLRGMGSKDRNDFSMVLVQYHRAVSYTHLDHQRQRLLQLCPGWEDQHGIGAWAGCLCRRPGSLRLGHRPWRRSISLIGIKGDCRHGFFLFQRKAGRGFDRLLFVRGSVHRWVFPALSGSGGGGDPAARPHVSQHLERPKAGGEVRGFPRYPKGGPSIPTRTQMCIRDRCMGITFVMVTSPMEAAAAIIRVPVSI